MSYLGYPESIYDGAGESIAASATYKSGIITLPYFKNEFKVFAEVTYHASATLGCRVDIIPIQPDGATECTDTFVTALTPAFTANTTKSKLGAPVDAFAMVKFKLAVVNLDTAQVLTLKKLYIY